MTVVEPAAPPTAALRPADAQQTFRAVLDALARPGQVFRLPVDHRLPAALWPTLALADLGTGVCLLDPDRRWAESVRTATSAPAVPLERARLVAALRPITGDEVRALHRGSAGAPERAALLSVAVESIDGGPRTWLLSGPGVPGVKKIAPAGVPDDLVTARRDAVAGFPAGIDVLLVAPDGAVLGLPRTTRIEEDG
ncbi:phosphonate C-P lyase system protein PhnH [Pseudonocardia acaciae]|uniref:phosphonate C-P lyase system protein PhnH n=1 Tax=Pseudonocardia acaciae TaxID=551276 RepID=UPI00048CA1DE|nr:phosphonate C-P lyase system protein PhnH [Pseudonocardia acaciae]